MSDDQTAVRRAAGDSGALAAATPRTGRLRALRNRLRAGTVSGPAYRIAVALVGALIIVGGLLLVPLPGPGWLIVFLGLGVLASEFRWAARLLRWGRARLTGWTIWMRESGAAVQAAVAVVTFGFVLVVVWGYLVWQGPPAWLPDGFERAVQRDVPGLD